MRRSSHTSVISGTLLDLARASGASTFVRAAERAGFVALFAAATAAMSQVSVTLPFTPVPLTLQPIAVLVGAAALGARVGAAGQMLYLALGLAGWPVFAASPLLPAAFARLLGPTGGYLLAYPIAAFVVGALAERGFDRRYLTSVLALVVGLAIVFGGGVAWLALCTPGHGVGLALAQGLTPFAAGDLAFAFVGAAALPTAWRFVRRTRN